MIAWTQVDPNRFERAIYSSGRLLNTRRDQLSADGTTLIAALDNKPVPVVGAAVISGTMTALRHVDGSTLEFTNNAGKESQVSVFIKQ